MPNRFDEQNPSLESLERWRRAHPGMSDGGRIDLPEDGPNPEDNFDDWQTGDYSEPGDAPAISTYAKTTEETDKIQKQTLTEHCLRLIFKALVKIPDHKLKRDYIRRKVLDNRATAIFLNELRDSHPLIKKYISIESLLTRFNRPFESWSLKPEALEKPRDLGWIFDYGYEEPKSPAAVPQPQPDISPAAPSSAAAPLPNEDELPLHVITGVSYEKFLLLPESERRRAPLRSGEYFKAQSKHSIDPDLERRVERERETWTEILKELPDSSGKLKLKPVKDRPRDYTGSPEESRRRAYDEQLVRRFLLGDVTEAAPIFKTPEGDFFELNTPKPLAPGVGVFFLRGKAHTSDFGVFHERVVTTVSAQPGPDYYLTASSDDSVVWSDAKRVEISGQEWTQRETAKAPAILPALERDPNPTVLSYRGVDDPPEVDSWHPELHKEEASKPIAYDSLEAINKSERAWAL